MAVTTNGSTGSNFWTLWLDFLHETHLVSQYNGCFSPIAILQDGTEVNLSKRRRHSYETDRGVHVHSYEIEKIYCGKIAFGYI